MAAEQSPPGELASTTYLLIHDGPGLQKLCLDCGDWDVIWTVSEDEDTIRVLHLQNVHEATLSAAYTAIDRFFDQLNPIDDGIHSPGQTVFDTFDVVREEMEDPVSLLILHVQDQYDKLDDIQRDQLTYPRRATHTTPESHDSTDLAQSFNPVAEMMAACEDFLKRVELIQSKANNVSHESRPKRDAVLRYPLFKGFEELLDYIEKQRQKRGLLFKWWADYYLKHSNYPKYDVYWKKGAWRQRHT